MVEKIQQDPSLFDGMKMDKEHHFEFLLQAVPILCNAATLKSILFKFKDSLSTAAAEPRPHDNKIEFIAGFCMDSIRPAAVVTAHEREMQLLEAQIKGKSTKLVRVFSGQVCISLSLTTFSLDDFQQMKVERI